MRKKLSLIGLSFLLCLLAGFIVEPQSPTVTGQRLLDDGRWPLPTAFAADESSVAMLWSEPNAYLGESLFTDDWPPAQICPPLCKGGPQ